MLIISADYDYDDYGDYDDHYCGRGQNFFEVDDVVGRLLLGQHPGQHHQLIDSISSA